MQADVKAAYLAANGIPKNYLGMRMGLQTLQMAVEAFRGANLLWLMQSGSVPTKLIEKPALFPKTFEELLGQVGQAQELMDFLGIDQPQQRIILQKKVASSGDRFGFIDNLKALRMIYLAAGLNVTDAERASLVGSLKGESTIERGRSTPLAIRERLFERVLVERADRLAQIIDAMELSEKKKAALRVDWTVGSRIILMDEDGFEQRWKDYSEGIPFSYDAGAGVVAEIFYPFGKTGLLYYILTGSSVAIRERLAYLRLQGLTHNEITLYRLQIAFSGEEHSTADLWTAGFLAFSRGDVVRAQEYFRQQAEQASRQGYLKALTSGRKMLVICQHLLNADAAAQIGNTAGVLEECQLAHKAGELIEGHFEISAQARKQMEEHLSGLSREQVRHEISREMKCPAGFLEEEPVRWLLGGTLGIRPRSKPEVALPTIKDAMNRQLDRASALAAAQIDLVQRTTKAIGDYYDEGEKGQALLFVAYCIGKYRVAIGKDAGLEAKAMEILGRLHSEGELDFDPNNMPQELTRLFTPIRLCFMVMLHLTAGKAPKQTVLTHSASTGHFLRLLTKNHLDKLEKKLWWSALRSMLLCRGLTDLPQYLRRLHPLALMEKLFLYEEAGVPINETLWWHLNLPVGHIIEKHLPRLRRLRSRDEWLKENLPQAPGYIRGQQVEKLNAGIKLAEDNGILFMVQAGYFLSYLNWSPAGRVEQMERAGRKVAMLLDVMKNFGFDEQEAKEIVASSYEYLRGTRLTTLAEITRLYAAAGLKPSPHLKREIADWQENRPRTHARLSTVIEAKKMAKTVKGAEPAPQTKPEAESARKPLEKWEENALAADIAAAYNREMRITGTLTAKNDATVLAAMRAGDERARQKLITGYLWLVPAILDKGQSGRALFSPENPAYLDAIQEGNLALVEAASTLPPGIPFAEHAAACIVQAIKKARPKFLKESGFSDRVKILLGIVVTEA